MVSLPEAFGLRIRQNLGVVSGLDGVSRGVFDLIHVSPRVGPNLKAPPRHKSQTSRVRNGKWGAESVGICFNFFSGVASHACAQISHRNHTVPAALASEVERKAYVGEIHRPLG